MKKILCFSVAASLLICLITGCGFLTDYVDGNVTATSAVTTTVSAETFSEYTETEFDISVIPVTEETTESPETTTSETTVPETTTPPATVTEATTTAPPSTVTEITAVPETTTVATTTTAATTTAATTTAVTTTLPKVTIAVPQTEERYQASPISQSYVYRNLSDEEKRLYDILADAIKNYETEVDLEDEEHNPDTVVKVMKTLYYFEPYYDYFNADKSGIFVYSDGSRKGTASHVSFTYNDTKSTTDANISAADKKANEIVAATEAMSDYQSVKYFHDTLIKNCVYDVSAKYGDTPYGALVGGRALCEGYAKAFSLLCNKRGIENTIVVGDAGGQPHAWNMVVVDGEWYCMDVTWDDTDTNELANGAVSYAYFLVTTEFMNSRVLYSDNIALPTATATKQNFYVKNGYYADDPNQVRDILFNSAVSSYMDGRDYVYFRAGNAQTYKAALDFIGTQEIFTVLRSAASAAGSDKNVTGISFLHHEEKQTITIILKTN